MAAVTGSFWFEWPLLALSLFNCVILLWLGLTVALNAERRTGGVWLVTGSALLGSIFFAAHAAILSIAAYTISPSLNLWWQVGWLPLVALPFAWYAIVLWYSGYGEQPNSPLRRRHRLPLGVAALWFFLLVWMLLFAAPLPQFTQVIRLQFASSSSLFGVPWFLLIYPLYILACTGLAFDALRRPGPAPTLASSAARQRARPWLLAITAVLLVVSVLVATVIGWVATLPHQALASPDVTRGVNNGFGTIAATVAWFDLIISTLIAAVSVLIGQAMVRYEIFSGRTLPRRELRRYWFNVLLLAAGYGAVVGATLAAGLRPIYSLLATALLMTVFFALLSWRSFARQEEFVRRLRPFVASPHLYEQLTAPPVPAFHPVATPLRGTTRDEDSTGGGATRHSPLAVVNSERSATDMASATFSALCNEVLHTDFALLAATGSLAPLAPDPLVFPTGMAPAALPPEDWSARFRRLPIYACRPALLSCRRSPGPSLCGASAA